MSSDTRNRRRRERKKNRVSPGGYMGRANRQHEPAWRPTQPLPNRLVLADRFRPQKEIDIHLAPVQARWIVHHAGGGLLPGGKPAPTVDGMSSVIATLAENFIPRVPCLCGVREGRPKATAGVGGHVQFLVNERDRVQVVAEEPACWRLVTGRVAKKFTEGSSWVWVQNTTPEPLHGEIYYQPATTHRLGPPDLLFALRMNASASKDFPAADLDETMDIGEYSSTFRGAIRAEHEERMRLYEQYSIYKRPLVQLDLGRMKEHDKASIKIEGIADARPSLIPGDTVLLRPIQPLVHLAPGYGGKTVAHQYMVEIESRVLNIVRGNKNRPDQVIISWDLDLQQEDALKDHAWVREYAIRFIPQSTTVERCLTALDWLDSLSEFQQQALKDILFPITGPTVKPLAAELRQVMRGVPTAEDYSAQTDISDIGKPLNELQSSFVRMVRARTQDPSFEMTRPPMILTGPAGTGKTKTLIYAIADVLGLLQQKGPQSKPQTSTNRVLICCPSHAACDVLTRRLSGLLKRTEIFRMYDHSRPISTVPGDIIQFTCQLPGSDRFTLPPPAVWTHLKAVVCTCLDSHSLFRAQLTNNAIRSKQQCFRTFVLSGSNPLGLRFGQVEKDDNPFFTHLFIDEAAQATEPEILCPISCVVDPHLGGRKVEIALVGDPRQLSPKVYANSVQDTLGRSFMERLLRRPVTCVGGGEESLLGPTEHNSLLDNASSLSDLIRYYHSVDGQEQLTVFLTENYRGHPSMLMMPSCFFYYDRLRSAKSMDPESLAFWCEKLRQVEELSKPISVAIEPSSGGVDEMDTFGKIYKQKWPIHFCGVRGADSSIAIDSFSGTDSWVNLIEAHVTVGIITKLIQSGVEQKRIGAMSPFRGQVVTIRKLLREKFYHDVNVGTVENYQAVEQDVIVLSLTRSEKEFVSYDIEKRMGIIGQPKQANVAMTRAENLFVVVGNPDVMWQDNCWKHWLRFCLRNGLWYGEALKQWDEVDSISYKGLKFVSTIDLADEGKGSNELVVSTLEKIQRVQSPKSTLSMYMNELGASLPNYAQALRG